MELVLAIVAFTVICVVRFFGDRVPTKKRGRHKDRTAYSSLANLSEKPFPNSRPRGQDINPAKSLTQSYNPLGDSLPDKLDDRYVYWEYEEGLQTFDERSEWELDAEDVESSSESKLSPILVNFPKYDYSIEYSDYKRWQRFCVKHNHIVPYRIFLEFDEGLN